jgi:uncharacterized protein YciI
VPKTLQILRYEYVPDIVERRGEHRPAHLEMIQAFHADGRLEIAGAVGDPPSHALLVFRDVESAEAFAADDPYVAAGLVTSRSIEPWNVVT